MGYGDGNANPMQLLDQFDIGYAEGQAKRATKEARQANDVAWEWKNHADKLKLELKESMRSQWNLAHQRDGWQKLAVHFWKKHAPDMPRDEFIEFYMKLKKEAENEKPTPQELR